METGWKIGEFYVCDKRLASCSSYILAFAGYCLRGDSMDLGMDEDVFRDVEGTHIVDSVLM